MKARLCRTVEGIARQQDLSMRAMGKIHKRGPLNFEMSHSDFRPCQTFSQSSVLLSVNQADFLVRFLSNDRGH
jgi:hypothetical protein